MPHFNERSYEKELLDGVNIPFEDIRQNMRELDTINTVLGGHRITLKGIKTLMRRWPKTSAYTLWKLAAVAEIIFG